jgi:hypothetical protein
MTALEQLKRDAEHGWKELMLALEGVTEAQAWAVLPSGGGDYLHTDGSIHGITLHIACGKWMNGSICFRNSEIRWREVADQVASFEPSWDAAMDYLRRGHDYWLASWATVDDLEEIRPTYWKEDRPAWRIIQIVNQHDSYHAGQIAVLRYANGESTEKPPSVAEDIREHCKNLRAW